MWNSRIVSYDLNTISTKSGHASGEALEVACGCRETLPVWEGYDGQGSEEETMRGDAELARHLPPVKRHAYLDADAVRRLVEALKPGLSAAANLEKYRGGWRLRITLNRPEGGVTRRSITLPDPDTAGWVRDRLTQARTEWREQRAGPANERAEVEAGERPPSSAPGTA